jgi:hypothetical protein
MFYSYVSSLFSNCFNWFVKSVPGLLLIIELDVTHPPYAYADFRMSTNQMFLQVAWQNHYNFLHQIQHLEHHQNVWFSSFCSVSETRLLGDRVFYWAVFMRNLRFLTLTLTLTLTFWLSAYFIKMMLLMMHLLILIYCPIVLAPVVVNN